MSFSSDIDNFAIDFIEGSEEAVRSTAISVFGDIIKESPVGEKFGGRFKSNWFTTGATPSSMVNNSREPSDYVTIERMKSVVENLNDWSSFNLTNNLPYAPHIEYGLYNDGPNTIGGFSRQAPSGLVRSNIARASAVLELEARRRLPR